MRAFFGGGRVTQPAPAGPSVARLRRHLCPPEPVRFASRADWRKSRRPASTCRTSAMPCEAQREWLAGVEAGRISPRRGRGESYSDTTIGDYRRSYRNVLEPEFGPMVADEIGEVEWQMFVDRLASEGLSRSRIASHIAVASAIYSWALTRSRRFVSRPAPARRAAAQRREATPARRLRARGSAAPGRAGTGRRGALGDRVLRGTAPSGDRPPRMDDVLDEQGAIGS